MTGSRIILIRYDEIGLKGKNRNFFEKCLLKNIRRALAGIEGLSFHMPHGRILIETDHHSKSEKCMDRLLFVPGIASASVGISSPPDFDELAEIGVKLIDPHLQTKQELKFCVRTQRSDKSFPKTSPEINFEVGSRIMRQLAPKGLTVNIKEAEFVLEIEIGLGRTIVFDNRVPGLSGLPVGSSGEVLSLISGGIDSPVASYMMMRRGCRVHFVFFDNRTFLGRGGYDKVLKLTKVLNRYQRGGKVYVVPFQNLQVAIRDHCRERNRVVLYRRMMYRIANIIAEKNQWLGLVTGESLGQVASQTLENLAAVSNISSICVYRPLIGMGKQEIISQARKIQTYDISIEPQPDCCSVFMPSRPVTRSKIPVLENDETRLPWQDLIREAMDQMEVIDLKDSR